MAETISATQPIADIRREGDMWRAYITPPWFRYLVGSGPQGTGASHEVLHGNDSGAGGVWGPVDLTTDVTGVLPAANGGVPTSGTANQVLHGGATPTYGPVVLTSEVSGILPVLNGGTGVTTSTGTGDNVLSDAASLLAPTITNVIVNGGALVSCPINFLPDPSLANGQILGNDTLPVSITGVVTTLVPTDIPLWFVCHDKTSSGMAMGVMDPTFGLTIVALTIGGVTFSHAAGVGLRAVVTAGASPRLLSLFVIAVGSP